MKKMIVSNDAFDIVYKLIIKIQRLLISRICFTKRLRQSILVPDRASKYTRINLYCHKYPVEYRCQNKKKNIYIIELPVSYDLTCIFVRNYNRTYLSYVLYFYSISGLY